MRRRAAVTVIAAVALIVCGFPVHAENVDPAGDGSQYAYSENAGWLNAEPQGDGGSGVELADFQVTGWMWGENLGWVSLSCVNRGTCGAVDFGVTNTGDGELAGWAWSENAGWISFSCADTDSCGTTSYGVTADPATGEISGQAWAENVGWISFSCEATSSCGTVEYGVATDWCQSTPASPAGSPDLTVVKSGADSDLSWGVLAGATWYELVRGDVGSLLGSQGDFGATEECLEDNLVGTSATYVGSPAAGEASYFLVRGVNCKGKGTYDTASASASQTGVRDGETSASGNDCR